MKAGYWWVFQRYTFYGSKLGGLVFEDKTPHRHGLLATIRAIKRCDSLVQLDGIHTHRILRQRGEAEETRNSCRKIAIALTTQI